ncbi:MAG: DNA primase large subunit PriL [Methanobacteriota archaeon]
MDPFRLARYPFLSEARQYILAQGMELEDLVGGAALGRARDRGERRVMEAIEQGAVQQSPIMSETDALAELFSYPIARMLVSCAGDGYLVTRYALAEAVHASAQLAREDLEDVIAAAQDLGMDAEAGNGGPTVHFTDFLAYSAQMRSPEWKLSNQDLRCGRALVSRDRLVRLCQQALQEKLESELPLPVTEQITKAFEAPVGRVKELLEQKRKEIKPQEMGRVSFLRMPPCMKAYVRLVEQGKNIPHSARFALVAFLHAIGMGNDDIVAIFATSPDFNEHMTRYQVDHISGVTSGVEYLPPECSTMKSYGICIEPDSLCSKPWMQHPLSYYRVKGKPRGGPTKPKAVQKRASEKRELAEK